MIFLSVPLVVLFYMLGGQINKLFRPIGVPLTFVGLYWLFYRETWMISLPCLLYGVILTQGYGVNSKLMKWLKSEQAVRIVLGIMVATPIPIVVALTHNWMALFGFPVIVACSCIRLGSWGKIWNYDILPVDIIRGLVLGLSMSWALL